MEKKVIFILGDSVSNYMFCDLEKSDMAILIREMYHWENPIVRFLYKVHCGKTTNRFFELPFKSFWLRFSELGKLQLKDQEQYVIFFTNPTVRFLDLGTLRKWSKKSNIELALIYFDTLDMEASSYANKVSHKIKFDYIFSYDSQDAQKYGFQYVECLYSRFQVNRLPIKDDLFFAGTNKGRMRELIAIYDYLTKKECKCNFTINSVQEKEQEARSGIVYNVIKEYPDLVQSFQSANCILEMLQKGQHGITLRTYEAVCYGKKLLTNNPNIVNFKFYDPRYMKIFNRVEEIDWEWVKRKETIHYNYHDEFSPCHLLEYIR